jgi:hypothetical protein
VFKLENMNAIPGFIKISIGVVKTEHLWIDVERIISFNDVVIKTEEGEYMYSGDEEKLIDQICAAKTNNVEAHVTNHF